MENEMEKTGDAVNHPSYYCKGGIECHDAVAAAVSNLTGIDASDTAQALQYLWRWKEKGGVEDVKKARWYCDRIIERETAGKDNDWKNTAQIAAETVRWALESAGERKGLELLASLEYRLEEAAWKIKNLKDEVKAEARDE